MQRSEISWTSVSTERNDSLSFLLSTTILPKQMEAEAIKQNWHPLRKTLNVILIRPLMQKYLAVEIKLPLRQFHKISFHYKWDIVVATSIPFFLPISTTRSVLRPSRSTCKNFTVSWVDVTCAWIFLMGSDGIDVQDCWLGICVLMCKVRVSHHY